MKNIFAKPFFLIFLFIVLIEVFSLLNYQLVWLNVWSFLILSLAVIILAFWRLDYAIFALMAELMVGSKGHFFSLEFGGFEISWRMVLFSAVMLAWLIGVIKRKYSVSFLRSKFFIFYFLFFILIVWGAVAGFIYRQENKNIFFDANAWLYFLLIFPVFDVLKKEEDFKNILKVFAVAISWLAIKTLIIFFIFTHQIKAFVPELYYWIRTRGLGEVTIIDSIYRVFFQSQIYSLIAFFIILAFLVFNKEKTRAQNKVLCSAEHKMKFCALVKNYLYLFFPVLPIILSFSRSFWLAFLITLFLFLVFLKVKERYRWLKLSKIFLLIIIIFSLSLFAIWLSLQLPPKAEIDLMSLLQHRITTEEAAVSSRLTQLPHLLSGILEKPILGSGFGKTISYFSRDPRALERHPLGLYTTYAFEWGYLDIWLKIGLIGLGVFLVLIWKIFKEGWKRVTSYELRVIDDQKSLILGLLFGLIALAVTHFTSPYLNHPLGIGYLILCALVFEKRHTVTY